VSSETKPLTREMVDEQMNLPPSPTERALSQKRVSFLRERFDAGLFHPPHWVQAIVAGKKMRANGMHSSTMLSKLNGSFPDHMKVHLDVFECPDMASLAMLFRQFDARQSARSPTDVAGAYQGLRPELALVGRHIAKLGAEAITWYRQYVAEEDDVPRGDDRYVVFNREQNHPFLQWVGELFGSAKVPPELGKPPVFAALYATFSVDKDAADDFWREVANGGREFSEDYPTTTLAAWLSEAHHKDFEVKPKGMYQGCIYAWNAVRQGKTALGSIKCDVKKALYKVM